MDVETKVIKEGFQPSILDFSIESDTDNLTEEFLTKERLLMVVSYNLETAEQKGLNQLKAISDLALKKGYTVIGLSASGQEVKDQIKSEYDLNFEFYLCDEQALKTVVRSNPGLLQLQRGTVRQKVHWNDIDDLSFKVNKDVFYKYYNYGFDQFKNFYDNLINNKNIEINNLINN